MPFTVPAPDPGTLELKARVETALEAALDSLRERVGNEAPEAVPLVDELAGAVRSGGKRIRPILAIWGYRAGAGRDEESIDRAAAAIELVHTFAILQDDLMDGARLRRGRPALHIRLATPHGDEELGAAEALLVADLAMIAADGLFADSGFPPERIVAAWTPFARMRIDAVAGQYLDLLGAAGGVSDEEAALRVGSLKSGRYTVEGPLLVGAELAGGDRAVSAALAAFGKSAGRAFQVRDDVLAVFGNPAETGKDGASDLRHGKPTVLLAKTLQRTSEAERRFLDARLGRANLTDGELEQVRQVILQSGALQETIQLITGLLVEAKRAIDVLGIPGAARDGLRSLADQLMLRPEDDGPFEP
jgi:geranylgeranyl diphosphate synthase, type I